MPSSGDRAAFGATVVRPMMGLVRFYQRLADGRPTPCRYVPTCSNYALDALEGHGAIRGGWLTVRRLSRCHPWGRSGWDPVPDPYAGSGPSIDEGRHTCST
ncbi:MAG: membrane protein insertion efficiency factor YidD [Actinomycetia bacterium]|jgi:hypothetical protein|nr:membrane protein insertion efficiency factor YidD [Actinomycetales bacterium]MCP4844430.1 membrane protein insertion efficiency factor YidD [Actinomycetes bacterium]